MYNGLWVYIGFLWVSIGLYWVYVGLYWVMGFSYPSKPKFDFG